MQSGCERYVPPQMLMCRQHWFSVPPKLRSRVWATYQDGQCDTLDPTSAYGQAAKAAKAAVIAVAEKEGRVIDPKDPKILLYDMLQVSDDEN